MRSPVLIAAFILSSPALAWDLRTDSAGDVVRWPSKVEMVLDAEGLEELPPGAEAAIRATFAHLDEATPYLDVTVRVGEAKAIGYTLGGENTNSIVVLEDWPYADDALAVTLVTLNARTNELLDADVAFNLDQHRFKVLPDTTRDEFAFDDVQNTFTHELGHVLGLMHNAATPELVMYPSAAPGEICKRTLKQDDRDGLLSLYGVVSEVPTAPDLPQVGCSASGTGSSAWVLLAVAPLLLLRRRRALVLALIPGAVLAAEPTVEATAIKAVVRADDVALVEVIARQSSVHPRNPGLIVTTLTLAQRDCLKGTCPVFAQLVVPGGRVGDLEQYIAHEPVPADGAQLVVLRYAGKLKLLRVDDDLQLRVIDGLKGRSNLTPALRSPQQSTSQIPATTP